MYIIHVYLLFVSKHNVENKTYSCENDPNNSDNHEYDSNSNMCFNIS